MKSEPRRPSGKSIAARRPVPLTRGGRGARKAGEQPLGLGEILGDERRLAAVAAAASFAPRNPPRAGNGQWEGAAAEGFAAGGLNNPYGAPAERYAAAAQEEPSGDNAFVRACGADSATPGDARGGERFAGGGALLEDAAAATPAEEKVIALLERQAELLEELVRLARSEDPLIVR